MSIVRRFVPLLLAVVLTLALALPAAAAEADPLSGLVQVEDEVCTISCGGETLAEFPVENPVHATITTTSNGTPAVVVRWGGFTDDEKRTVLLPAAPGEANIIYYLYDFCPHFASAFPNFRHPVSRLQAGGEYGIMN